MDKNTFIKKLFARAAEMGVTQCEAYYASGSSFDVNVFKGEVIDYSASDAVGLGFRALVNGKMGYASTQALDEEAIELLVNAAMTNAALIESEDEEFMYDGSGEYAALELYDPALDAISAADKIAMAKDMEKRTLAADSRIDQLEGSEIMTESSESMIVNTLGLNVSSRANLMCGVVSPVARDGEKVASSFKLFTANGADTSDSQHAIDEAVSEAVANLYADSVPSGEYPIIMRYDAMTSLISTFSGVFSADNAQKGLSLLAGREGEKIASDCVTLADDPHMAGKASSTPFDGEGVPTSYKELISGGVLTTLMHNLKTAKKQGVKSTGNGSRPSYASPVGIAPTTLYIKPGEKDLNALAEEMGDGLVITQLEGLHAGANPISGDFSLGAKGYKVEGGKLGGAVKQITIAGNFYQLLKDVVEVGSDLRFGFPGSACFGSPSVRLTRLSVAGK